MLRALPAEHSIPNSSLEKGRKVVSSLRFLLKSMHSTLSFFLIALIFFKNSRKIGEKSEPGAVPTLLSCPALSLALALPQPNGAELTEVCRQPRKAPRGHTWQGSATSARSCQSPASSGAAGVAVTTSSLLISPFLLFLTQFWAPW